MIRMNSTFPGFKACSGIVFLFLLGTFTGSNLMGAEGVDAKKEEAAKKKDPAKMTVKEAEAAGYCPCRKKEHKLIYHASHEDTKYHFCSRECQQAFKKDPAKFLSGTVSAEKKKPEAGNVAPKKKKSKKEDAGEDKMDGEMDMDMDEMDGE